MSKLVCVDYGHWESDSGATDGSEREDIFAKLIGDILQNNLRANGINTTSSYGTLEGRTKMANDSKADLTVSIHLNSTKGATGNEIIISKYSKTARSVAEKVLSNITLTTGLSKRGVRVDTEYLGYNSYVLKNTVMTAILVECGFIQDDWTEQNKGELSKKYADGICNGILEHFGVLTKCPTCGK